MKTTALILAAFGFVACGGEGVDIHTDAEMLCLNATACGYQYTSDTQPCIESAELAAISSDDCAEYLHKASKCVNASKCTYTKCDVEILRLSKCE